MYVILAKDVPQLGSKNALVNVAKGYYANFLYPRGLANRATAQMLESLQEYIISQKKAAEAAARGADLNAEKLRDKVLKISAKTSKKGTLFKAIAEKTLAKDILREFSVEVDPKDIKMEHIKEVGEHRIEIKFGADVVRMKVAVVAEEEAK